MVKNKTLVYATRDLINFDLIRYVVCLYFTRILFWSRSPKIVVLVLIKTLTFDVVFLIGKFLNWSFIIYSLFKL